MTPGPRYHKQASLRIAIPTSLPEEMRDHVREIIDVRSEDRRKGYARALMHSICAEADREWKTLFLHVEPFDDGAMSAEKLELFYQKFGFRLIQQRPMLMARDPEKPRIMR